MFSGVFLLLKKATVLDAGDKTAESIQGTSKENCVIRLVGLSRSLPQKHVFAVGFFTRKLFCSINQCTVNCSYTGLGLGLRFRVRYMRNPVYPNSRLCTKHTVSCFCAGLKFSGSGMCEFRYYQVRYKSI